MSLITKPGVYDLTLDQYHGAEPCAGPSISSSGLVNMAEIMGGCPARYWWESPLNPNREPVDTEALRIGRAVHTLVLEGELEFASRFGLLPEGMDLKGNAGKAIKAEIEAAGKIMIRFADLQRIKAMAVAITSHPRAKFVFTEGAAEKTLAWQDEVTGVWLRARPDWLPRSPLHIPDLKSAADASRLAFEKAVWDYGYHMKAAHVCDGIRALGLGDPKAAYFVVQEKKAPFLAAVYALNGEALEWGSVQNRASINTFARCLERNHWPGYAERVQEINLPIFAQNQLKAADLSGAPEQETTNEPSRYAAQELLRAG